MTAASWAVQRALHAALTTSPSVLAVLGGPRIYDDVPRGAAYPYMSFGLSTVRDWSTGNEDSDEHVVTLHVWSQAPGRQEAQEIIAVVRAALHDQSLALTGHRLINLRHEFSDTRREADAETFHGIVRFRAVTEPVG